MPDVFAKCHQLKVLNSVVSFVAVFVVNNLVRLQRAANVFGHKTMLKDIPVTIRVWMIWAANKFVAATAKNYASFPRWVDSPNHFSCTVTRQEPNRVSAKTPLFPLCAELPDLGNLSATALANTARDFFGLGDVSLHKSIYHTGSSIVASITQSATVLADGFDLSPFLKSIEPSAESDVLDASNLGTSNFRVFAMGLTEWSISGEGYFAYDAATDAHGQDAAYAAEFGSGTNRIISIGKEGSALGAHATLLNTKQASYKVNSTIGDLLMTQFEAKASLEGATAKPFANGGVWLMNQSVTAPVNGTGYDDGAGATTGWIAHLHITAENMTVCQVKFQHSTDNISFTDLGTFTTTGVVGAEQIFNTAASVNRYIRAAVILFTGTSATVAVAVKTGYTG
jgi:hypothetical protein